jgi:hypothetical protein
MVKKFVQKLTAEAVGGIEGIIEDFRRRGIFNIFSLGVKMDIVCEREKLHIEQCCET